MKFDFFIVTVVGLEAEMTTSCPDQAACDYVVRTYRRDGVVPIVYSPGTEVPDEVSVHVA